MAGYRPVLEIIGILLIIVAALMLLPLMIDATQGSSEWRVFAVSSFAGFFLGGSLILTNHGYKEQLTTRQTFLLTTSVWVVIALFSALPFLFSTHYVSYTDAFFESMSGITSSGASIIQQLDAVSDGILFWRAMLNWMGGVGVVVIAMAVFPMLKVGGMQLFKTESSDKSEKIFPRATQLAGGITKVYILFTILVTGALYWAGMGWFDALCHAMTAVSTGGFSNYSNSIAHFDSLLIEGILIVTMIVSALPYVLYIQMLQGHFRPLWKDSQVHTFMIILLFFTAAVALWLHHQMALSWFESVRRAFFNVTAIITTTGFSQDNYALWGTFPVFVFVLLSCVGGCTGSTAGAIKIFRIQILYESIKTHMLQLMQPHGVFKAYFNKKPVSEAILQSVLVFFFIYMLTILVFGMLLAATGVDFLTGISSVTSALAGAGYGLGRVGPDGSYALLPDAAKWLLSIAMLLGRLEFFTVLILFSPSFWRD